MTKVLILGATGMLGTAVLKEFEDFKGDVTVTSRGKKVENLPSSISQLNFDAAKDDPATAFVGLGQVDYVVNCIGIIKPYISDSDDRQRLNALQINSLFPQKLAEWASSTGAKVIQIATDCVFSGSKGSYLETDAHDALDVYGKSKSLGEVPNPSMMHLRVSIIGPEAGRSTSLLEWVRNQPEGAEISGFTDHVWNGVTTTHFGKIARGIIESDLFKAGVFHVVPGNRLTKDKLVQKIASVFGRDDIKIQPKASGNTVDRTLETNDPTFNAALWAAAGYQPPPTVEQMLAGIAPQR
jgi:dTDP-4-dehydrorhamnose reductase